MEEKSSQIVKELNRSTAHPIVTLPEAVPFVLKIYSDLGYTNYHDKDTISKIFGLSYDSIKQRLSTSGQYGLLDLKHGTGYKIAPVFLKIYRPESDAEKREGVIECLRSPFLYDKLISEFDQHPLPSVVGLSTTLFRRHGLNEKSAERAAQVFLENMRIYDLVDTNNILRFTPAQSQNNSTIDLPDSEVVFTTITPASQNLITYTGAAEPAYLEIPIKMQSGNKAIIKIPEDALPEDYQKIAKVIQGYL